MKLRSIAARLQLVTVTAVLTVVGLLTSGYIYQSANLQDTKLALLRSVVESATAIAAGYEQEERAGRMSRDDAQHSAAKAIGAIRYSGSEYVWINDLTPRMVMHPIKPELNGTDLTDIKDPNGKRLFVEAADVARTQGAGMVDYFWPRPGAEQPV